MVPRRASVDTKKMVDPTRPIVNGTTPHVERRPKNGISAKEFTVRNSPLTDLWSLNHIKSIYNIALAICINLAILSVAYIVLDFDSFKGDVELLVWTFGKLDVVLLTWIVMFGSFFFFILPLLRRWASRRKPSHGLSLYDYAYMALYGLYQFALITIPARIILNVPVPPASSAIIAFEQVRFVMKAHAFVRENFVRVVAYKLHQDDDSKKTVRVSSCRQLMYFLFAPTLVYRDHYPRTEGPIQWSQVGWNLMQVLFSFVSTFFIITRFVVGSFGSVGRVPMILTAQGMFYIATGCVLAGSLLMFLLFYSFLHCWHNMFAELLSFGDRQFYKEWWNSTSLLEYYRTWNCIVHDWLYAYVYRDIYLLSGQTSKRLPFISVFLLSAIFHEYIIAMVMHYFLPILMVMFVGIGVCVAVATKNVKSAKGNLFLWMSLFQGWGIMLAVFSMAWYCHLNCGGPLQSSIWSVIPNLLRCISGACIAPS